uniref:hypothetical protein n=1 Tax=Madagascaria erythrocladioides TaxID=753684 RepID=UPI001BF1207D|nr:hypothetical protein MW574_pgp051 [Madagascaria erythrocladioides]QUE29061.1 Ycf35 [Madagascaria erythrocladioides]UNJ16616.1 hypothetical protein [Madagascaria erythrocladioides]
MSHFSKIKTTIRDIEMLKLALTDLGLNFDAKIQTIKGYQNQQVDAELVIKQVNNYDFGFTWNGREYELIVDAQFWNQPWSVDCFLEKLMQAYAYNSISKQGYNSGFEKLEKKVADNGAIKLTFQRWIN